MKIDPQKSYEICMELDTILSITHVESNIEDLEIQAIKVTKCPWLVAEEP